MSEFCCRGRLDLDKEEGEGRRMNMWEEIWEEKETEQCVRLLIIISVTYNWKARP